MDISRKNKFDLEIQVGDIKIEGTFSNENNELAENGWVRTTDKDSSWSTDLMKFNSVEQLQSLHQAVGEILEYLDKNKPLIEKPDERKA